MFAAKTARSGRSAFILRLKSNMHFLANAVEWQFGAIVKASVKIPIAMS